MSSGSHFALVVRLVLWLLSAYHLVMGAVALFSPRAAPRVIRAVYGASLGESAQLLYLTSMIGALALVIGGLAAVAALSPDANHPIIASLVALQLARIFCRVRDRRYLAESFRVSARSNAAAIAVMSGESVILCLGLR